jgi:hypothetical protein
MVDVDSLTEAEQRLIDAVKTGSRCDFAEGEEIQPGDMAHWGPERTIRAAVLKSLVTEDRSRWDLGPDAAEASVRGAVVSDDLTGVNAVQLSLQLDWCRFDGDVSFERATFDGSAAFTGAAFRRKARFAGATFTGDAVFSEATFTGDARFSDAKFTGDAVFSNATFTGDAVFSGATFTGDARFSEATFTGDAVFTNTKFTGDAVFSNATFARDARFDNATFTGTAWFVNATFEGTAWFDNAPFIGDALFRKATFAGHAWFSDVRFTGDAVFTSAPFTRDALFRKATFARIARFDEATFASKADFRETTFTADACFRGAAFNDGVDFRNATFDDFARFDSVVFGRSADFVNAKFKGPASFHETVADELDLSRVEFSAPDPGPWIATVIRLQGAVFAVRSRIKVTARDIYGSRLQAPEGVDLILHCAQVDLSDAAFLRSSSVSTRALKNELDRSDDPAPPPSRAAALRPAQEMMAQLPTQCSVTSLSGANIGQLSLSDVILDNCTFARANGLDTLRIGTRCSFRWMPPRWDWLPITHRQVIADEMAWRNPDKHTDETIHEVPVSALEIARIYRELRKGREDAKNEPGANDFYYGEMEMRRLAGREATRAADGNKSSRVERALLCGYWAVSGYGLRAWRALLTLAVVLITAGFLYTLPHPQFASLTPQAQISKIDPISGRVTYASSPKRTPNFSESLEFAARESISLLQGRTTQQAITTEGPGTVLDFVLRLAGPLLLAFTILALRARTRR